LLQVYVEAETALKGNAEFYYVVAKLLVQQVPNDKVILLYHYTVGPYQRSSSMANILYILQIFCKAFGCTFIWRGTALQVMYVQNVCTICIVKARVLFLTI